jgi:hypothetical protein
MEVGCFDPFQQLDHIFYCFHPFHLCGCACKWGKKNPQLMTILIGKMMAKAHKKRPGLPPWAADTSRPASAEDEIQGSQVMKRKTYEVPNLNHFDLWFSLYHTCLFWGWFTYHFDPENIQLHFCKASLSYRDPVVYSRMPVQHQHYQIANFKHSGSHILYPTQYRSRSRI